MLARTIQENSKPKTKSSIPGLPVRWWGIIVEAIIWGFVALLTPCVFSNDPDDHFVLYEKWTEQKSRALSSSVYGISIVLLYTLPIAAIIMITYFVGGKTVTADIF